MTRSHSNSKNVTFLRIANTRRKSQVVACARCHDLMIHVMRWFFYLNNCFYTPGRYIKMCSLCWVRSSHNVCCPFLLNENALSYSLSIFSRAVYYETTAATKIIPFLNSLLLRRIRLRLVTLALFFLSSSSSSSRLSLSFPPLGDFQRRHELVPETERQNAFHEREIIPNPVHEFLPVLG